MSTAQDFSDKVTEVDALMTGGWGMEDLENGLKEILAMLTELWQRVEALEAAQQGGK